VSDARRSWIRHSRFDAVADREARLTFGRQARLSAEKSLKIRKEKAPEDPDKFARCGERRVAFVEELEGLLP
jgi:hypothetical protein